MHEPRILLMYVHEHSGHHRAALALEKAFKTLKPGAECRLVDVLRYCHPLLERLIRRTYLKIIQTRPEVWEYLYDNPWVVKNTQSLRQAIHRADSRKFKALLAGFRPGAMVCTQAFPCGIASDYKITHAYPVPLYGVLTDYLPHSYWVLDQVDQYFVPSREAKEKLHENGVYDDRISVTGIPVDLPAAKTPLRADPARPRVLVMGGSQGMGPIEKIVQALDHLAEEFEITVLTGKNEKLYRRLAGMKSSFRKKVDILEFEENIIALMRGSAILVSKPGGLTITQALCTGLPMIFIDPIPGQEAKNASFLLKHRAAVEAKSVAEVVLFVSQLFRTPAKLSSMKQNMHRLAKPDAALRIARKVLS